MGLPALTAVADPRRQLFLAHRCDATALDDFQAPGRIHTHSLNTSAAESAYAAWKIDRVRGLGTLLIAADNAAVTEVNRTAHNDHVGTGAVDPGGVLLADDTIVGIGDRIIAPS